jgi:hypothetical protein
MAYRCLARNKFRELNMTDAKSAVDDVLVILNSEAVDFCRIRFKERLPQRGYPKLSYSEEALEFLEDDFDRLYKGVMNYKAAILLEADSYNSQTKDVTRLISLWNAYVQFVQSFPDHIPVPDTPDGHTKAEELRAAFQIIPAKTTAASDLVTENLQRDIQNYVVSVAHLHDARENFEERASYSNSLTTMKRAIADAQRINQAVHQYVVVDNDTTKQLFDRFQIQEEFAKQYGQIDQLDLLRDEYCQYALQNIPKRTDFIRSGRPWNSGAYEFALVNPTMRSNAEAIVAEAGCQITSGYRNPKKQVIEIGGSPSGPHVYGYAVDLSTNRSKEDFLRVAGIACSHSPSWIEPATNINENPAHAYDHVHADWRPGDVASSYCNVPPRPTAFKAEKLSRNSVKIKWNKVSTNADYFSLEQKTGNGSYSEIKAIQNSASKQITVLSYVASNLPTGTHSFRVRAINDLSGKSEFAPPVEFIVEPESPSRHA